MNNEPVALTQGDILSILQDANSVLLDQPIWNSTEEYNKLKAIIESAIRYTHPVKEQNGCGNCHACLVGVTEHGLPATFQRMILCPDCGNKRCPKASNHRHQCTESNEPNQRGSIYTHPVTEHFEGEPQAEELHEILQSNSHPVKEQLTDEEMAIIKEAVGNYVCTIKMEIDQEKQTFKGYEHCSNLPSLRSELKDAEQALAILRKAQNG